jgi:NADPH:quinone reductase
VRAQLVHGFDGPAGLRLQEVPAPADPEKVKIAVRAAGVSFPDLLFSYGRYQDRPALPFVPGLEVAGTVIEAPAGSGFRPGDRVAAYTYLGGFAEVAATRPEFTFAIPDALDFAHAGALVVNYHTAHVALARRGRVRAGETVLVHGAAGGLGTAAIQVARGLGARALAVVSTAEKARTAADAGAEEVIVLAEGWHRHARSLAGGHGVDVVFDPVGGARLADSLRCLAPEGRLLVVGFAGGEIPSIPANRLLLRNIDAVGVLWYDLTQAVPAVLADTARALARMLAAGAISPLLGARYPLEEAPRALQELESRRARGKLVLEL